MLLESLGIINQLFAIIVKIIRLDKSEVASIHCAILSNFIKNFPENMETNYFSDKLQDTFELLIEFSYNTSNSPPNGDYT